MNKDRRKVIAEVRKQIEQAQAILEAAAEALDTIKDEETDYFYNMPDSIQESEKGEKAQAAIDHLENAAYNLETIGSEIEEALESLENAVE